MNEKLEKFASRLRNARHYYEQSLYDLKEAEQRKAESERELEQIQPGWEMPAATGLILTGAVGGFGAGAYAGSKLGHLQDIPLYAGGLLGISAGSLGAYGVSKGVDKMYPDRPILRNEISRENQIAQLAAEDVNKMKELMATRAGKSSKELRREIRSLHNQRKQEINSLRSQP